MIGIDTNVLVRYLAQEDARQTAAANAFIENTLDAGQPGYVNRVVLCELVWVLESAYGYTRTQIAEALQLSTQGRVEEADALRDTAFAAAPDTPGSFNDTPIAWIADADSRFGPTIEAIIGGRYGLLPFSDIAVMVSEGPRDLRDLVWYPVELTLKTGPRIAALKQAGCLLLASVTSLAEAQAAERAGIDMLVAQGYEAGGHRGVFDPHATDDRLGTLALTRLLAMRTRVPVIAAGGIMDGAGVAAALGLGAVAAQLGTAFIACPESAADAAYRAALMGEGAAHTVMTRVISGRPARCLPNRFTLLGETLTAAVPDYPIAYDAGKALNAAAKAQGEDGYGAQWAGQGAPLARALPAADLVRAIAAEMRG